MLVLSAKSAILGVIPVPQVEPIRAKIGYGKDSSISSGLSVDLKGGTSVLVQPAVGGDLNGHIILQPSISHAKSKEPVVNFENLSFSAGAEDSAQAFDPSHVVLADSGLIYAIFVRERGSMEAPVQMDYKMAQDPRYSGVLEQARSLVFQVSDAIAKAA